MKCNNNLYIFVLFILVTACEGKKDVSSAEIVELIRQDALSVGQVPIMTNEMELVYRPLNSVETSSFVQQGRMVEESSNTVIIVSDPVAEENLFFLESEDKTAPPPPPPFKKSVPVEKRNNFLKIGSYIKVGNDTSGQVVSPRSAKKITSVVVTGGHSVYIDIYLYAIPKNRALVRNANTLIGFVRDLDVINNQVQFTKFWNARLVQGRFLKPGEYNIYMFYSYKDRNKKEITSSGRFWGGDHRRWIIKVF